MSDQNLKEYIGELVEKARKAQAVIEQYSQEQVDKLTAMLAYEMTRPNVKDELAKLALEETELGDYDSKIGKIDGKVKGVFYEIKHEKTVGVVEEIPERGLRRIAKPVGVIGALIPSTQPEMIPITTALFSMLIWAWKPSKSKTGTRRWFTPSRRSIKTHMEPFMAGASTRWQTLCPAPRWHLTDIRR